MLEELQSHNQSLSTQEPTPNASVMSKVPEIKGFKDLIPSQTNLNDWEDLAERREQQSARYRQQISLYKDKIQRLKSKIGNLSSNESGINRIEKIRNGLNRLNEIQNQLQIKESHIKDLLFEDQIIKMHHPNRKNHSRQRSIDSQ